MRNGKTRSFLIISAALWRKNRGFWRGADDAAIIVPPRTTAVLSKTAETDPTQRDRHLQCMAEKGRMVWQQSSGYNRRAQAETIMARWKRVIGDGLRAH